MSDYRQQQEDEEAHQHLHDIEQKFYNGELDDRYSDWLMHEHDLHPPITSGDMLLHHMEKCTRADDFIYEVAFGKGK